MESTGVYWIPLFEILDSRGFQVVLANARQVSHVPGRKTNILDCQWLQLLHAYGLLKGSFRPSDDICRLRALIRERDTMVEQRSDWIRRMQKCMDQINVCVHHAVSDITGVAIIRAIVNGERYPGALAQLRNPRCRKSEEQIAEELTGNWRSEHLFNLRQALKMYDQLCTVVDEYNAEILAYIKSLQPSVDNDVSAPPPGSKTKAKNMLKRGQEPMRQALYQLSGVDLTTIDGIAVDTATVVISELCLDFSPFPDENHFVSYLRLAPNLSISAGKKVPSKFKATTCTRVATALRMAALTLRNSKTALGAFYRRMSRRKGASVAFFATARKLVQLIYRLVCYGQPSYETSQRQSFIIDQTGHFSGQRLGCIDIGTAAYKARINKRRVKYYTKTFTEMGYNVEPLATAVPIPA